MEVAMKRICLPLLLLLALLLSGCGSAAGEKQFRAFSEELSQRDQLDFRARLRAEYPDKSVSFLLDYAMKDGEQTVTVAEPENIAGIRARLLPGETRLEYQDLILDTGDLDKAGLTPMSALPTLVEALRRGHLDSLWQEDGEPVVQLVLTDALSARVRFRPDSMTPTHAELISGDTVTVTCEINDWR